MITDKNVLLQISARLGHLKNVKYLISKDASIDWKDDYALRWAARNGHLLVVQFLIKMNSNINGYALRWAARNGNYEIVCLLAKKIADIKKYYNYAINRVDGSENAYFFLEREITIINANNANALRWAARKGHNNIVQFLINNNYNENTLIYYCIKGDYEIVAILIKYGADIHNDYDYALRMSVLNRHLKIVELLLKKGADIHAKNDYAFRCSCENGYLDISLLLYHYGADIHVNNDESFRRSVFNGHIDIINFLIKYVNVNHRIRAIKFAVSRIKLHQYDNKIYFNRIETLLSYCNKDVMTKLLNKTIFREKLIIFLLNRELPKYSMLVSLYRDKGIDLFDLLEKEKS